MQLIWINLPIAVNLKRQHFQSLRHSQQRSHLINDTQSCIFFTF